MGVPDPGVVEPVLAAGRPGLARVNVCGEVAPVMAVTCTRSPPTVIQNGKLSASPVVVTHSGPLLVRTLIEVAPSAALVLSCDESVSMWQMSSPVDPVAAASRITFHGSAED